MTDFIKTVIEQGVGHVVLTRSELHNAFNDAMIGDLRSAFESMGSNPEVRVVVLSAEGKSFCAGADLNWMKRMVDYTFEENVADARALSDMLQAIHDCPKPVIAKVHGAAFGGGVGLVSACDMAVALESATFSLSEVKLGLLPAVISPFVLEKIGPGAARRYFLTAERFSASEAKRIGLLSEVVTTPQEMEQWVHSVAEALKANGPEAVSYCKRLIDEVSGLDWEKTVDITTRRIAERRSSTEGQEGMKSFLEKRSPAWLLQGPAHV